MQRTMGSQNETFPRLVVLSGAESAVAGIVAGAMMAMFAMVVAGLASGYGFWAPPRAITAVFFGEEYLGTTFAGSMLTGIAIHMVLSGVFGMMYAFLIGLAWRRVSFLMQVAAATIWGIVLWAVNTLIAPALPGGQLFTDAMPAWAWFAGHVLFGMVLGGVYAVWRQGDTGLTPKPATSVRTM